MPVAAGGDQQDKPGVTVLVVDDDDQAREEMRRLVVNEGYAVTAAASGGEALAKVRQEAPSLVLTELFMPGIDGWELLAHIKRSYPQVHVVVTTGNVTDEAERLLTSRRADGYLLKPLQPRRLQIMLRALLLPDMLDRDAEAVAADPDRQLLDAMVKALGERGVYVHAFTDLRRAEYQVREGPPDLLITEIEVGGRSGLELCETIRRDRQLPYVPILIVSGRADAEVVRRAARLHVNAFIRKPFIADELTQRAMRLLRQGRRARSPG